MDNEAKLFKTVSDTFNVTIESVNFDTSEDAVKKWDSLGLVTLVSELELAFDVEFDLLEILDMKTVGIIRTLLIEKGLEF